MKLLNQHFCSSERSTLCTCSISVINTLKKAGSQFKRQDRIQSGAAYRSQDFVVFFIASCEGLPGQ